MSLKRCSSNSLVITISNNVSITTTTTTIAAAAAAAAAVPKMVSMQPSLPVPLVLEAGKQNLFVAIKKPLLSYWLHS